MNKTQIIKNIKTNEDNKNKQKRYIHSDDYEGAEFLGLTGKPDSDFKLNHRWWSVPISDVDHGHNNVYYYMPISKVRWSN